MVFKLIGGSYFSFRTCNSFKISLIREGILHISVIGTAILNFPNLAAKYMFNLISSSIGVGFGNKSCTRGGSGGTTFYIYGGLSIASGLGKVEGCDEGIESLFILVYATFPLFLSSFV
jgi:hypothetical protein